MQIRRKSSIYIFLKTLFFCIQLQKQPRKSLRAHSKPMKNIKAITILGCLLSVSLSFSGYVFNFKSSYIPHPKKAHRGGQDAFFANQDLMMIADGVGGWQAQGVDPSGFARQLAKKTGQSFTKTPMKYQNDMRKLVEAAHEGNDLMGSATYIALTLDFDRIKSCYLGDSGFIIIRQYPSQRGPQTLIAYQYSQQQHSFNFPFQLAPKKIATDTAKQAICVSIEIQVGDIIVAGSDGLFDNIPTFRLKEAVKTALTDGTLLTTLPQKLAKQAIQHGHNPKYDSPFAQNAKQQGILFNGGKLDDTTVIIGRIIDGFGQPKSTHFETNPELLQKIKITQKRGNRWLQQETL